MDSLYDFQSVLTKFLLDNGYEISQDKVEKLIKHSVLVKEKNKQVNLTAITDDSEIVIKHIIDSLLYVHPTLPYQIQESDLVLDIGSGAGYPGLPINIVSNANTTLMDSVNKKVDAINSFIKDLRISNAQGVSARAEEYAINNKEKYTVITFRAVAKASILLEYAQPFLKKKGCVILSKTDHDADEISHAIKVGKNIGLSLVSDTLLNLPENNGNRHIYIFQKTGKSNIKLPRPNGFAKNKPL